MFSKLTKFQRTVVIFALIFLAAFLLLGWAGDYDYCEQIILHMSQEQYDSIKSELTKQNGSTPSDRDIAHYWAEQHKDIP